MHQTPTISKEAWETKKDKNINNLAEILAMYDVAIIGAGFAGSKLFSELEGLDVIIFDDNPGSKKVSAVTFTDIVPKEVIRRRYSSYTLMTIDGSYAEYSFEDDVFCLVDYAKLCRRLVGDHVIKEKVLRYSKNKVYLSDEKVKAKVIVDCSGISGEDLRRDMFQIPPVKNAITFEKLRGDFDINPNSFYLIVGYANFGGWIYPEDENVIEFGMANRFRDDSLQFPELDFPKNTLNIQGEIVDRAKSIYPYGFVKRVVRDDVILFGDACGLTHPVYGMSLHYIYKIAPVLANHIKRYIKDEIKLSEYQSYWRKLLRRGSNLISQGYASWDLNLDEQVRLCKMQIEMEVSPKSIKSHIWALDENVEFYAKKQTKLGDYPIKLHLKTLINKIKIWL